MEQFGNNVIETTATEMDRNENKTTVMSRIKKTLTSQPVKLAAAALLVGGVAAKTYVTIKNHNETTEEV